MMSGLSASLTASGAGPNGSAPRCEHMDGLVPVMPQSDYCLECRRHQSQWQSLLVCLSCGWVACSDDSPGRHAEAHYRETDHPLNRGLEPGSRRRWCYVHRRLV
jgi:uncharacterized UBP type Zn finger protein